MTQPEEAPFNSVSHPENGSAVDEKKFLPVEGWLAKDIIAAVQSLQNGQLVLPSESRITDNEPIVDVHQNLSADRVVLAKHLYYPSQKDKSVDALEIARLTHKSESGKIELRNHSLYIRRIKGTEVGECVLIAGKPEFDDVDTILTLRGFLPSPTNNIKQDAGTEMIDDVLRRSSDEKLMEGKLIKESSGEYVLMLSPYRMQDYGINDREDPAA
ncbi:MAG: hypothetical protein HYV40_02870 [Candidatus Levybacteria bacterium]|nr:hypothetical protein [Candidatus Levybacteria bacterium]